MLARNLNGNDLVTRVTTPAPDICQHNCQTQQNRESKTITDRPLANKKPFTAVKTRRPRPLTGKIPSQNNQQNTKQKNKKLPTTTEATKFDSNDDGEELRDGKQLDDNFEDEEPTPEPEPTHIGNPRYHAFHSCKLMFHDIMILLTNFMLSFQGSTRK